MRRRRIETYEHTLTLRLGQRTTAQALHGSCCIAHICAVAFVNPPPLDELDS